MGVAGGVLLLRADAQLKTVNAALQAAEALVRHTLDTWRQAVIALLARFFLNNSVLRS